MLSIDEAEEGELQRVPLGPVAEGLSGLVTDKWADQQDKKIRGLDTREEFRKKDEDELQRRRSEWQIPPNHRLKGVLGKYAKLVTSASQGAVTR